MKNVNLLHVSLFKIITSQKKLYHTSTTQNTATPSGNTVMKFSAEVSEAHAAARVKGPEAANVDNEAALRRFNNFF